MELIVSHGVVKTQGPLIICNLIVDKVGMRDNYICERWLDDRHSYFSQDTDVPKTEIKNLQKQESMGCRLEEETRRLKSKECILFSIKLNLIRLSTYKDGLLWKLDSDGIFSHMSVNFKVDSNLTIIVFYTKQQ